MKDEGAPCVATRCEAAPADRHCRLSLFHVLHFMSPLRYYPPVHAPVSVRGVWAALGASLGGDPEAVESRARAALAELYPRRRAVLTNSGTSALQLALQLTSTARAGADRAGIVALPAYACPDLGTAAIGANFSIRLYDVDPRTLQPDWDSLERALSMGVTHVVGAHLYGRLVDIPEMRRRADAHGAIVIEDAAQHAGGTLHGVRGGALADISVLSFGRGKGINAGGGGALLLEGEQWVTPPSLPRQSVVNSVKIALISTAVSVLSHPLLYRLPARLPGLGLGETVYHAPGNPEAIAAASAMLLLYALRDEAMGLEARRAREQWYSLSLAAHSGLIFESLAGSVSGALRFPIRLSAELALGLKMLGVSRSYPKTLAEYPELCVTMHARGATALAAETYTLATHKFVSEELAAKLVAALSKTEVKRVASRSG